MKLACLSNININMLKAFLPRTETYLFPEGHDTLFQQLTDSDSELYAFCPEAVFLFPHAETAAKTYGDRFKTEFVDLLFACIDRLRERLPQTKLFVAELLPSRAPIRSLRETGADADIAEYNHRLWQKAASQQDFYVFPMQRLVASAREDFFSDKLCYLGKIPYSMAGQKSIAEEIAFCIRAMKKQRKKCLVLDLDNTLWGGVVGEDGIEGIRLAPDGEGKPYYDAQKQIKNIQETGVLLAVLSKNNEIDALSPFRSHKYCVLKESDFAAFKADWSEKTQNIFDLAQELNIGLDAMVFLDDNPVEREKMRTAYPQVTVVDFPKDVAALPQLLGRIYRQYFLTEALTKEDRSKTDDYRAESERRKEKSAAPDIDAYIRGLQIKIDLHRMRENEIERVAQLTQKTNQFNLTTKRFTVPELRAYGSAPGNQVYTAEVTDRYGPYGLVMVVMIKADGAQAHIDNLLMSCRVMGRDVENSVMSALGADLIEQGIGTVTGEYIETEKNKPVSRLLERWGFAAEEIDGGKRYHTDRIVIKGTLCEVIYDR